MARSNKFKNALLAALEAGVPANDFLKTCGVKEASVIKLVTKLYQNIKNKGWLPENTEAVVIEPADDSGEVLKKLEEAGISLSTGRKLIEAIINKYSNKKLTVDQLTAACVLMYNPTQAYSSDINSIQSGVVVMTPEISTLLNNNNGQE